LARCYDARSLAGKRVNKRALQQEMGLQQNDDVLLCGMVTRLTDQKGVDLVLDALPALLERPLQLALLGTGDAALERAVADAAAAAPGRVAAR
ncbi:starch synthase, partial [Salmonella enterica subsp. enterica serovar Typhimurium]|nr:starch synthase [Salmonella enterica subsp. enterica serovar Typhimurium]